MDNQRPLPPKLELRRLDRHLVMGRRKAHQALLIGYFRSELGRNGMKRHYSKLSPVHDLAGGSMGGNLIPCPKVRLQMTSKVQEGSARSLIFWPEGSVGVFSISFTVYGSNRSQSACFHFCFFQRLCFVNSIFVKNSFIFVFLHFFNVFEITDFEYCTSFAVSRSVNHFQILILDLSHSKILAVGSA